MKTPTVAQLTLPEIIQYQAAHVTTRTRKIGDGRFAAIGAIYCAGRRGMYVTGLGATRSQALKSVNYTLETGRPFPANFRGNLPDAAWESEMGLRAIGA